MVLLLIGQHKVFREVELDERSITITTTTEGRTEATAYRQGPGVTLRVAYLNMPSELSQLGTGRTPPRALPSGIHVDSIPCSTIPSSTWFCRMALRSTPTFPRAFSNR